MPSFKGILPALEHLVEYGRVVKDSKGDPIRNFVFLPRYISVRPPAWLIEYWLRTDPRLTYKDLKARMAVDPSLQPKDNAINMRREREVRGPLGLSCWTARLSDEHIARVEVERIERWSLDQVRYNTTMIVEYLPAFPKTNGDIPFRLRSKSLVPGGRPQYYPLTTFLDHRHMFVPSRRILRTQSLFWSLRDRAKELGLRTWQLLPDDEIPEHWKAIQIPKKFTYINTKKLDRGR